MKIDVELTVNQKYRYGILKSILSTFAEEGFIKRSVIISNLNAFINYFGAQVVDDLYGYMWFNLHSKRTGYQGVCIRINFAIRKFIRDLVNIYDGFSQHPSVKDAKYYSLD